MAAKHDALDTMYAFLKMGAVKSNIPLLKENCELLITALTQKTGGQEKYHKPGDVDFAHIDAIVNCVVIEALCLYLSGDLEKLEGSDEVQEDGLLYLPVPGVPE